MSFFKISLATKLDAAEGRKYPLDIIRACAVLFVLCFHLQVPGFSWGFLGVDLFLFLSGILVSSQVSIFEETDGKYNSIDFLRKRLLRIFQPIVLIIPVIWLLSIFFVIPSSLKNSFILTPFPLILSNYFFSSAVDYFGESASSVLLLHFWSLGLELFFYLFLFFISLKHKISAYLACFVLISVLLYDFVFGNAGYYTTLAHSFPFFCGCFIASRTVPKRLIFGVFAALTLGLCLVNMERIATILMTFLGVTLLYFWYRYSQFLTKSNRPSKTVTWLATRAYEVYLLHWPLIVIWFGATFNSYLNRIEIGLLLIATLVGAEILYQVQRSASKALLVFGFMVTCMVQLYTIATDGLSDRLDPRLEIYGNHKRLQMGSKLLGEITADYSNLDGVSEILVVGDSHGRHLSALILNAGLPVRYLKTDLRRLVDELKENPKLFAEVEKLVLSFHWSGEDLMEVQELLELPMVREPYVSLVSEIPNSKRNLVRCFLGERSSLLVKKCDIQTSDFIAIEEFENLISTQNLMLKNNLDINVLDWEVALCDDGERCRFLYEDLPIYRDNSHLSERLPTELSFEIWSKLWGSRFAVID